MKIPLPYALVAILLAAVTGCNLGVYAAGPMPTITRYNDEPERNYTLETLRTLAPPPKVEYVHPSQSRPDCRHFSFATMNYYNPQVAQVCD